MFSCLAIGNPVLGPLSWQLPFSHQPLADSSLSTSKHYNRLHTFLTMLFHSPLISFVATIALASGITASVTTVRRDLVCTPGTGSIHCCGDVTSITSLPDSVQSTVKAADPNADYSLSVGLNCSPGGSQGCGGFALCSNSNLVNVLDTSAPNLDSVLPGCTAAGG